MIKVKHLRFQEQSFGNKICQTEYFMNQLYKGE